MRKIEWIQSKGKMAIYRVVRTKLKNIMILHKLIRIIKIDSVIFSTILTAITTKVMLTLVTI